MLHCPNDTQHRAREATTNPRRTGDIDIELGDENKGVGVAIHQEEQEADSGEHSTEAVECPETSDYDSEADEKEKDSSDGKPFSLSAIKVPSQVFMEEARRRAIKKKEKAGGKSSGKNSSSLGNSSSSSSNVIK